MNQKSNVKDMTKGSIAKHIIAFTIPLLIGNMFQMLYNTIDSLVVGNFVGTQALAAIGSTTMIVNIIVFFFNGLSTGATVLIGQLFGSKNDKKIHVAIETTMALTFVLGVIFTIIGIVMVPYMLKFMSTPIDVIKPATNYLQIYFAGIIGLLIYNMGSGILRAVGDSKRPILFLIFTSIVNTILDLLFVIVFNWGIVGVAIATIISQFISGVLVLLLLIKTKDIYYFRFKDLTLNREIIKKILQYGLPAALQSTVTAFSNVFVQSYINVFGSSTMAGWSVFNKIDQFIFLPIQSMAMASTAFVSQNIGAGKIKRANKGTKISLIIIEILCVILATIIFIIAPLATKLFTSDSNVIYYGTLFLRLNVYFLLFNAINHTLAGALRGRGDSIGPMVIMLVSFVLIRQIYLLLATSFIANNQIIVGLGYPVGWSACCIIELIYFYIKYNKKREKDYE